LAFTPFDSRNYDTHIESRLPTLGFSSSSVKINAEAVYPRWYGTVSGPPIHRLSRFNGDNPAVSHRLDGAAKLSPPFTPLQSAVVLPFILVGTVGLTVTAVYAVVTVLRRVPLRGYPRW
jgi:hypothetical protein